MWQHYRYYGAGLLYTRYASLQQINQEDIASLPLTCLHKLWAVGACRCRNCWACAMYAHSRLHTSVENLHWKR